MAYMEMRSSRTRMMIFKMKEAVSADCFEQRRNEAFAASFILENHTAGANKYLHVCHGSRGFTQPTPS